MQDITAVVVMWILPIIVGVTIGGKKGRPGSGLIWAALFSWVGVIIVACLGSLNVKKCPRCAESVMKEAIVCKHCGHEFKDASTPAVTVSLKKAPGPDQKFIVFRDGKESAPLTWQEVTAALATGTVSRADYVRHANSDKWFSIAQLSAS